MPRRRTYPAALATSRSFRPKKRFDDSSPEERHQTLLDTAEQRVAASGLLRTTIPDIANAVGVPAHGLRTLFGNREALIEQLLDRHMDRLIDRLRVYQSDVEGTDPTERPGHAIATLLDLVWVYRAGHRVHVAAFTGAPPQLVATLKLRQRHLVYVYAGLIPAAVPEAESHELAMPAALNLMGMVSWHILWFREMGALTRAALARLLTHMVIEGVRAAIRDGVGRWADAQDG